MQSNLFEELEENRQIQARYRATFTDRKIARHLISADEEERDTIMRLMYDAPEMTLYEAIELCIKYPAERT